MQSGTGVACFSAEAATRRLPSSVWNPGQHRQLHAALSCRRGTPYSSGPISRRCPPRFQHRKPIQSCAQADRCCFLLKRRRVRIRRYVHGYQIEQCKSHLQLSFCGGRPPLNELPVDSHCRHRKPMQQSAKWTRRQASPRHRASSSSPHLQFASLQVARSTRSRVACLNL